MAVGSQGDLLADSAVEFVSAESSLLLPVVEEGAIGVPQAPAGADLTHRLEVWSLRGARAAGGLAAK